MSVWGVELQSSFPPDRLAVDETLPYPIIHPSDKAIPRSVDIDPLKRVRLAAHLQLPKVKAVQYILGMGYEF